MDSKDGSKGKAVERTPEATLAQFAQMAQLIPDGSEDTDGTERILRQILGATDATQLDSAWSSDTEAIVGKEQSVTGLKRLPSDFKDGLGVFLVVESVITETGEMVTWTTSAVSVVGQLVKAYAAEWLPLPCVLRRSDRPTANGYYPQHLEILRGKVPFES